MIANNYYSAPVDISFVKLVLWNETKELSTKRTDRGPVSDNLTHTKTDVVHYSVPECSECAPAVHPDYHSHSNQLIAHSHRLPVPRWTLD